MTKFVRCGKSGVDGEKKYGCVALYRDADPNITGDQPRVQLEVHGVRESFYDATVCSAEMMGVPVCVDCPARRLAKASTN